MTCTNKTTNRREGASGNGQEGWRKGSFGQRRNQEEWQEIKNRTIYVRNHKRDDSNATRYERYEGVANIGELGVLRIMQFRL